MVDVSMDRETKQEKAVQQARAKTINSGARGADGLTELERGLLEHLRRAGFALVARQDYPRYVLPVGVEAWNWQQLPLTA